MFYFLMPCFLFIYLLVCIIHVQIFMQNNTLKMLGCFNPILGQIWTNPAIRLHFLITFLTQCLSLSIFDPKLGLKQPSIFLE